MCNVNIRLVPSQATRGRCSAGLSGVGMKSRALHVDDRAREALEAVFDLGLADPIESVNRSVSVRLDLLARVIARVMRLFGEQVAKERTPERENLGGEDR